MGSIHSWPATQGRVEVNEGTNITGLKLDNKLVRWLGSKGYNTRSFSFVFKYYLFNILLTHSITWFYYKDY
jgi:hypothetical protein